MLVHNNLLILKTDFKKQQKNTELEKNCIGGNSNVLSRFRWAQLFVTLWIVVHQAPVSKDLPRQKYWSGLQFPSPGDLPDPGIEPVSLMSPALAGSLPLEPGNTTLNGKVNKHDTKPRHHKN